MALLLFGCYSQTTVLVMRSLCPCNNAITHAFVSCDRFWRSPILAKWRNDLYVWSVSVRIYFCVFVFVFFVCSRFNLEPIQ